MISDITAANFTIAAMEMFYLDRTHAEEFYEIYKGVLGEYSVSGNYISNLLSNS